MFCVLRAYDEMIFCSGFWPTLAVFIQKIPVLGWLFQQPYIRSVSRAEMSFYYHHIA